MWCGIRNIGGPLTAFFQLNLSIDGSPFSILSVAWMNYSGIKAFSFQEVPKWIGPEMKASVEIHDPQEMVDDIDPKNDRRTETWERNLPDLVVISFYRTASGTTAVISNDGTVAVETPFSVSLSTDHSDFLIEKVNATIHPGSKHLVAFDWSWKPEMGPRDIEVQADTGSQVDESREDNNIRLVTWRYIPDLDFVVPPTTEYVGESNATISWKTTFPTKAQIAYGKGADLKPMEGTRSATDTHSYTIGSLDRSTQYRFKAICEDTYGRSIESDIISFNTKRPSASSDIGGEIKGTLVFNRTKGVVIPFISNSDLGVSKMMVYVDGVLVKTISGCREKSVNKNIALTPDILKIVKASDSMKVRIDVMDMAGKVESFQSTMRAETAIIARYPRIDLTTLSGVESGVIGLSARVRDPDGITDVTWKVDGSVLRRQVPILTDTTFFFASVDWDSTLNPDGRRRVTLEANNTVGNKTSMSMYVDVDNFLCTGDPDIGVTRQNIRRTGSICTVPLQVRNWGTEAAIEIEIDDLIEGYVPIEPGMGSEMYSADGHIWHARVSLDRLGPGETATVTYKCIPALLSEDDEHLIGYSLNHPDTPVFDHISTICDYLREDGAVSYQWTQDMPALQFVGGDFPETGAERAIAYANYMVLTNPTLLADQVGEWEASRLIIKAAELAAEKSGIMGFIIYSSWTDPLPTEEDIKEHLIEWAPRMNPLFSMAGYLAILGEDTVIPTWFYNDVVRFEDVGWADVPLSDHGYSDLNGDDLPDLSVGRFIGRTQSEISTAIQTSLDVMRGDLVNDCNGKALLISGSGSGVIGFREHLRYLARNISSSMASHTRIDRSSFLTVLDEEVDFEGASNHLACGDVDGDGKDEVLMVDSTADTLIIINDDGSVIDHGLWVKDSDWLTSGNVWGTNEDEILHFTNSGGQGKVKVWTDGGSKLSEDDIPWQEGSPVCIGDYNMDGEDDIITLSMEDDEVHIFDKDMTFEETFAASEVHPGQRIGAGDMDGDGDLDIVQADDLNDMLRVYLAPDWAEFDIPVAELEATNGFAVGDFSGRNPAEAVIMWGGSEGYLQVCWMGQDAGGSWTPETENKFLTDCRGGSAAAVGDFLGDGRLFEVIYATEGGSLQVLDTKNVGSKFKTAVLGVIDDTDLLVFSDHGGQDSWSGLMGQDEVPTWGMDTWYHRPVIYAAACSTGDYASGPDSMAVTCLREGAGVYIGATRSSQIPENNLAMQFLNEYVAGGTIGMALRNFERRLLEGDFGIHSGLTRKWAYEYQLFGDPAFGTYAGIAPGMMVAPARAETEKAITVPDPEFIDSVGGFEAIIPGGNRLSVDGEVDIPFYTWTIPLPKNITAYDLNISCDGIWTYYEGLELDLYGGPQWAKASRADHPEGAWYPDQASQWCVRGSDLRINLFPFQYSSEDLRGRFCRNWTVTYETTSVPARISHATGPGRIGLGDAANLTLTIEPIGGGGSVALYIAPRDEGATDPYVELSDLIEINSTTTVEYSWVSIEPGAREFVIELRDFEGRVLDSRCVSFQVGSSMVSIDDLIISPASFENGTSLEVTCHILNVGDFPLFGNASMSLLGADGSVIDAHFENMSLPMDADISLSTTLKVPDLQDDVLTVKASFRALDIYRVLNMSLLREGYVPPVEPPDPTLFLDCTASEGNMTEGDSLWFNGSVKRSDGLLMDGITVGARLPEGDPLNTTSTDAGGEFRLMVENMTAGNWTISVGAKAGVLEAWTQFFIRVMMRSPIDNGTDDNDTDDNNTDDPPDDNTTDDDDNRTDDDDKNGTGGEEDDGDKWKDDDGLVLGLIIAVVGSVIVIFLLIVILFLLVIRRKEKGVRSSEE